MSSWEPQHAPDHPEHPSMSSQTIWVSWQSGKELTPPHLNADSWIGSLWTLFLFCSHPVFFQSILTLELPSIDVSFSGCSFPLLPPSHFLHTLQPLVPCGSCLASKHSLASFRLLFLLVNLDRFASNSGLFINKGLQSLFTSYVMMPFQPILHHLVSE